MHGAGWPPRATAALLEAVRGAREAVEAMLEALADGARPGTQAAHGPRPA
jgi:hypothetical protein